MSGWCDFCQCWHSASCCHPGRAYTHALEANLESARDRIKRLESEMLSFTLCDEPYKCPVCLSSLSYPPAGGNICDTCLTRFEGSGDELVVWRGRFLKLQNEFDELKRVNREWVELFKRTLFELTYNKAAGDFKDTDAPTLARDFRLQADNYKKALERISHGHQSTECPACIACEALEKGNVYGGIL